MKIIPSIKQGDVFIENFRWESKKKKVHGWGHFWNQYGMNTISFSDFQRLTENVNCVPIYSDFSLLVDDIIDAVLQKVMKNNVN